MQAVPSSRYIITNLCRALLITMALTGTVAVSACGMAYDDEDQNIPPYGEETGKNDQSSPAGNNSVSFQDRIISAFGLEQGAGSLIQRNSYDYHTPAGWDPLNATYLREAVALARDYALNRGSVQIPYQDPADAERIKLQTLRVIEVPADPKITFLFCDNDIGGEEMYQGIKPQNCRWTYYLTMPIKVETTTATNPRSGYLQVRIQMSEVIIFHHSTDPAVALSTLERDQPLDGLHERHQEDLRYLRTKLEEADRDYKLSFSPNEVTHYVPVAEAFNKISTVSDSPEVRSQLTSNVKDSWVKMVWLKRPQPASGIQYIGYVYNWPQENIEIPVSATR